MTIRCKLSPRGIQSAIDALNKYRKDLSQKTETLLSSIADKGAEIARGECPIRTGQLYSGIEGLIDSSGKALIRVNCPYAVYVEMGTGIKGANSPHPDTSILGFSFQYDRNSHSESGWWYPTDEKDPNPTKITAKNGKMYAWTAGMPSRPFMYNTAQAIKNEIRNLSPRR